MKARVWNRHPKGYEHKEKFRDEWVTIPAGQYVVMDYEDAVLFRGQYFPMKFDAQGVQDPVSYKVIHIETMKTDEKEPEVFRSMIDGREFATEAELNAHLAQFKAQTFTDEEAEAEIPKKKRGRPPVEKEKVA